MNHFDSGSTAPNQQRASEEDPYEVMNPLDELNDLHLDYGLFIPAVELELEETIVSLIHVVY